MREPSKCRLPISRPSVVVDSGRSLPSRARWLGTSGARRLVANLPGCIADGLASARWNAIAVHTGPLVFSVTFYPPLAVCLLLTLVGYRTGISDQPDAVHSQWDDAPHRRRLQPGDPFDAACDLDLNGHAPGFAHPGLVAGQGSFRNILADWDRCFLGGGDALELLPGRQFRQGAGGVGKAGFLAISSKSCCLSGRFSIGCTRPFRNG